MSRPKTAKSSARLPAEFRKALVAYTVSHPDVSAADIARQFRCSSQNVTAIRRRHGGTPLPFNAPAKRAAIAAALKATPTASDHEIAKRLGVSDEPVGDVRQQLGLPTWAATQEAARRARVAEAVRANPDQPNAVLAKELHTQPKTVISVRAELGLTPAPHRDCDYCRARIKAAKAATAAGVQSSAGNSSIVETGHERL